MEASWTFTRQFCGRRRTNQIQIRRPSMRKKIPMKSTRKTPAPTFTIEEVAENTPETSVLAFSWSTRCASASHSVSCSSRMRRGPSASHWMAASKPATAWSCRRVKPMPIARPAKAMSATTEPTKIRIVVMAAATRGKRRVRCRNLESGSSATVRNTAMIAGTMIWLSWITRNPAATATSRITSERHDHAAITRILQGTSISGAFFARAISWTS